MRPHVVHFLRVLGITVGVAIAVIVLPCLACRVGFVSYRDVCERAGGSYGEIAHIALHCSLPSPSMRCPPPFEPLAPGECGASSETGLACRSSTW